MFLWYGLVVLQGVLNRYRNHKVYFVLGKASIPIAMGVITTGVMMSIESYRRSGDPVVFTINFPITINFIILYFLTVYLRKYSDQHKRLILFSSIAITIPAFGRIIQATEIDGFLSIPIWLLLLLPPVVYDLRSIKRIHKSTWVGLILITLGIALTVILLGSSSWVQFLESTIGTG